MSNRKAKLYAVTLFALAACTKQEITSISGSAEPTTINATSSQQLQTAQETTFGIIEAQSSITQTTQASISQTEADMDKAGVNLVRIPIFLSQTSVNKTIDQFIADGYNVQVNANWNNGVNGLRAFPSVKDTNLLKSQADAFFKYYASYKTNIPFVVVENEWDYQAQYGANVQDYLTELSIITTIGHKYGFKIADGGITSGALQRWTYSQLSGTAQQQWKADYYVGDKKSDYASLMNIVNTYIAGAKNINFDYSNAHWYNSMKCGNGFATATQTFMKACNKNVVVCNEFGIRTSSSNLFNATVNEIKGNSNYGIAYSGTDAQGKAIKLTDDMLIAL